MPPLILYIKRGKYFQEFFSYVKIIKDSLDWVTKVKGLRREDWWSPDSHEDVKDSVGNRVSNIVTICTVPVRAGNIRENTLCQV